MSKKSEKSLEKEVTLSPREQRLANAAKIGKKDKELKETEVREEFRRFFIQLKRKYNLDSSLENIIWLHFKSSGFNRKEKFIDGIKHFGYDIV